VNQDRVHFDGDDFARAGQQGFGEGSLAGADFNDQGRAFAARRGGNGVQNGFAGEEVLP
jgi:hypothetical protein